MRLESGAVMGCQRKLLVIELGLTDVAREMK